MATQNLADIKRFLANSSIHATPDWVEGCVEFFISENHNERYTYNDLKEFVLDQWKLADLREMGQGCFPPNLSNIIKITLPGKYSVQVEWIKNVGQSAYTQLQNKRKQVNENTDIGVNMSQAWEPKPTRMLQLSLCDGKQSIKGIEYKPIRILNEELLPGFKLLIVGPVECRRGIVLLEEHNLKIIGGEIDTLLIPNAIENVLARTLNLEPNPDPYKTQTDPITTTQISSRTAEIGNANPPLSLEINTNLQTCNGAVHDRRENRNQGSGNIAEEEFLYEDDEMDDEIDAHLSKLEHQYQEQLENININESELDELEQKYLGEIQTMGFEEIEFSHEPVCTNPQPTVSDENNDASHLLDDDDDDFLCQMSFEALERTTNKLDLPENNLINSKQNPPQIQTKTMLVGQSRRAPLLKAKNVKPMTQSNNKQSKITSFLNLSSENSDSGIGATGTSKPSHERSDLGTTVKACARKTIVSNENRSLSTEGVIDLTNWPNGESETSKHNEVKPLSNETHSVKTGKQVANIRTPVMMDSEPFVYLSQIKLPVECRKLYVVKAFVLTLLSQLTFGKDGWQLSVKLCDGSSNLDVKLSSDVLERLIGFSAVEMRTIRQDVPKNPLLKDKLKNILQNAQHRLINLNCLLKIEFLPGPDIPCVTDIEEIAECHLHALQARLDSAYACLTK